MLQRRLESLCPILKGSRAMLRYNPSHRQLALLALFFVLVVLSGLIMTANYATANGANSVFLPLIENSAPGSIPVPVN
jgi:hypothetical protein